MTEAVSLTSITETPLVILNGQRVGPATGLPTWTEQADLSFVLSMGHGDIQRIVLTPGTIEEHFNLSKLAFQLAEKYQIPVFIMSDKFALESYHTLIKPDSVASMQRQSLAEASDLPEDNSYRRYKLTDAGISPRSLPGQPHGLHLANSYEHDEYGYATEEASVTKNQVDKRTRKMTGALAELPPPVLLGPAQADLTLVGWGSTVLVLQELINQLAQQPMGKTVNAIHLPSVWPFPVEAFTALAKTAQKLVMVEGNAGGQAEKLIRQETGITLSDRIHRYDGRPFYVEELIEYLKK
jgi:2-oxoglutarate ferredoxin oxidoreductase subunit alpha